jgi:hypothetical protein
MKLYEIKRGSKLYEETDDGSKVITFDTIDGMYSHCTTEKGNVLHIGASTELEGFKDGYKIKQQL